MLPDFLFSVHIISIFSKHVTSAELLAVQLQFGLFACSRYRNYIPFCYYSIVLYYCFCCAFIKWNVQIHQTGICSETLAKKFCERENNMPK